MYSTIWAGGLHGIESYMARVEVDAARGLPGFEMVGLLGSEVKEARERIRVALRNSGIQLPPLRITINISPASLHKEGTAFDLAVAAGILVSLGILPAEYAQDTLFIGELGLNGEVKPVRGVLPIVMEAVRNGIRRCIVPAGNAGEARMAGGLEVSGVRTLEQMIAYLTEGRNKETLDEWETEQTGENSIKKSGEAGGGRLSDIAETASIVCDEKACPADAEPYVHDFAEVRGQEVAKRAALAAAAGFHHFLMIGPPGSGKSMIAGCLPSILPPLTEREQLEVSAVYSVAGLLEPGKGLMKTRPFVSPHHTSSGHALAGGGTIPRPGAVSLAHAGVLFLDEMAEFRRSALDVLRQPMEERKVCILRNSGTFVYPADFMLVGAMNPCPCGYFPDRQRCRCTPNEVRRYLSRVSGPILDRIDISTEVSRIELAFLQGEQHGRREESSRSMSEKVMEARERQEKRYKGTRLCFNSQLSASDIRKYAPLGLEEEQFMEQAFESLRLSARAYHRIIRVARTLADLDSSEKIAKVHLSEAACYRLTDSLSWKEK